MRIAIIGMACLFPGAPDLETYWRNIVNGVDAIGDVPAQRWDRSFFDPGSKRADRFYCRRGGFVDEFADFDPLAFGIMPNAVEAVEPDQLLTLRIGQRALRDAGYDTRPFARQRSGVIVGRGNYVTPGVLRLEQRVRLVPQILRILQDLFPDLSDEAGHTVRTRLEQQLTHYGPDVAADLIPNLIASRLANRLDLQGPAYSVDAACASSLIALEQACASLARGETDMMLVGGAHLTHDLTFWATFCQLGALSRSGMIRPLAADADGILAGEGVGMVVLKRLDEAEIEGDRIYAVIEGVGSSSDGRSSSMISPDSDGQHLALERAWRHLSFERCTIGLLEAHGTATPAGDAAELDTIARFFGPPVASVERAVIGSVKSMIGHAMPASGMASLIKTALAIHHGVLPPTLHCEHPHPRLAETRFCTLNRAQDWQQAREHRVAALNAFGFGGINAHVVLRGTPTGGQRPVRVAVALPPDLPPRLVIGADSPEALLERFDRGDNDAEAQNDAGVCRLVVIEPTARKLETARRAIVAGKPWNGRQQIWFSPRGQLSQGGKLAFVFPGVDSVFEPQAADLAQYFHRDLPRYCQKLDPAQALPKVVVGLLGFNRLVFDILCELGIRPDGFAGHSVGEWSAMLCSGMMAQALSDRANAGLDRAALQFPEVHYLAANCDPSRLLDTMHGIDGLTLSHDNCPHQAIACGAEQPIIELTKRLRDRGVVAHRLPFSSGFHTPLFAPHMRWYRDFFGAATLVEPAVPVWSATTARPYPSSMAAKQALVLDHLLKPVLFRPMIEAMYDDGFRIFVQVGTGSLAGFIDDTLAGKPHHAVQANHERRSGLAQLQQLCAALWVEGARFDTRMLRAEMQPSLAVKEASASTRRLLLGVPLLRLEEPLEDHFRPAGSRPATAALPAVGANDSADDAVGRLVRETLMDIERTGREVLELWQKHRESRASPVPGKIDRVVQRLLDLETTIPGVRDHGLYPQREGWPIVSDSYPVVPLTMEILLVRQAVEEALPHLKVIEVAGVSAYNWLVVAEPLTVDIQLRSIDECTIDTEIVGYFRARVRVAPDYPAADLPAMAPLQNRRDTQVDATDLYAQRWMFHGRAYQGVKAFSGIGDNGIDGRLQVPEGPGGLLDNMGQLAGYWVMEQPDNCLAMPTAVDRICFYGQEPGVGEVLDCAVRIDAVDEQDCLSSHQLRDSQGRLRVSIHGWRTRRYQMDKTFWVASRLLSRLEASLIVPPDVAIFEDRYDTALMRDYICRRYLTAAERAVYDRLAPGRRRQWLAGRVSAKDAARAFLRRRYGLEEIFPQELCIVDDDDGRLRVEAHVTAEVPRGLVLALAQDGDCSAAIVGERAVGIGLIPLAKEVRSGSADTGLVRREVALAVVSQLLPAVTTPPVIEAHDGDCFQIQGYWIVTHQVGHRIIGWNPGLPGEASTRMAGANLV